MVEGVSVGGAQRPGGGRAREQPVSGLRAKQLEGCARALRSQIGNSSVAERRSLASAPSVSARSAFRFCRRTTFLENIFVAQVQTSYTLDFFGAAVLADRALARQVQRAGVAARVDTPQRSRRISWWRRSMPHRCRSKSTAIGTRWWRGRAARPADRGSLQGRQRVEATRCSPRERMRPTRRRRLPALRAQLLAVVTRRRCCWGVRPTRRPRHCHWHRCVFPRRCPCRCRPNFCISGQTFSRRRRRYAPRRTRPVPPRRRCFRP